jgi:hypothetical protein
VEHIGVHSRNIRDPVTLHTFCVQTPVHVRGPTGASTPSPCSTWRPARASQRAAHVHTQLEAGVPLAPFRARARSCSDARANCATQGTPSTLPPPPPSPAAYSRLVICNHPTSRIYSSRASWPNTVCFLRARESDGEPAAHSVHHSRGAYVLETSVFSHRLVCLPASKSLSSICSPDTLCRCFPFDCPARKLHPHRKKKSIFDFQQSLMMSEASCEGENRASINPFLCPHKARAKESSTKGARVTHLHAHSHDMLAPEVVQQDAVTTLSHEV